MACAEDWNTSIAALQAASERGPGYLEPDR
jgi:hypothetical protein